MGEFIVVTWSAVQGRMQEHDHCIGRIMDYWRRHAGRFKLKSFRYFAQGLGGDPFGYGHALIYEFESLADWETFETEMASDRDAMPLKEQLFANIDLRTRRAVAGQAQR